MNGCKSTSKRFEPSWLGKTESNMKTFNQSLHLTRVFTKTALLTLIAVLAASPGALAAGRNPNPGVLPINSNPYGQSYGSWGAAWWKWVLEIPKAQNPNFDTTGEFCHVGQSGPVWFLAGNFGGEITRSCTVPAGKALFFPILNNVYWAPEDLAFVKDVIAPSQGWNLTGLSDEEILRMGVNWATDHATALSVTIDGAPILDPWQYRADSDPFTIELSDALADFGYPPGTRTPNVAAGYWIMLRPLSPGWHTINFTSSASYSVANGDPFDTEFSLDVTWRLTVE